MFRPLKSHQLIVDICLGGLFAVCAIWLEAVTTSADGALPIVAVSLLFGAALAARRLAPGLSLGVAWVAALVQMAAGRPPGVSDLAIFAVLFATAAYGSRAVFWAGFASAILGAGTITAYLFASRLITSGADATVIPVATAVLFAALFALLLSWTVGALVRTALRARSNRLAQERAQAEAVAEQERVRIARDMHDVVAHSLAVVIAQADGARYAAAADPGAADGALTTISTTARAALADVRLLLTQLRHSQADGPQPTVADLEALYAQVRAAGVPLQVDVDPAPHGDPPAAVQLAVYRILQEALTNALRHGSGGPVGVRLAWDADRVDLTVRNPMLPGTGSTAGHGLIGMRERAQLAGGRLDAAPTGEEFVVTAVIPIGIPA